MLSKTEKSRTELTETQSVKTSHPSNKINATETQCPATSKPSYLEEKYTHVVFLHTELSQKEEDLYLMDVALALDKIGHQVTIYTCSVNKKNCLDSISPISGQLRVLLSGWWIPNSIFGLGFRKLMNRFKAIWMAFQIVWSPPSPKPSVVILDTDVLALLVLSWFSEYFTIFIPHFPQHQTYGSFMDEIISSDLLTSWLIDRADKILVKTKPLQYAFQRSFPKASSAVAVLHSCYDSNICMQNVIDIRYILPRLPKDAVLFATFGCFRRRSNFPLVVQAVDYLYSFADLSVRNKVHVIISGECNEESEEQECHYKALVNYIGLLSFASQVTFLKNAPPVVKDTLMYACGAIIHPTIDDIYPGPILTAMNIGRPIIAVNSGFAKEVLEHQVTGLLVEPSPKAVAKMMKLLIVKPTVGAFLSVMAQEAFNKFYSPKSFRKQLSNLLPKTEVDLVGPEGYTSDQFELSS